MAFENILFESKNGVARITLNRPKTLNSFNAEMHAEMREAIHEARENDELRCLLLTGAGRGFCAGQDLGERIPGDSGKLPDFGESVEHYYNPLVRSIMNLEKPVVCAVNGMAAGAGASLALACDVVFAARSASFIQSFVKIGLIPGTGGTWNLTKALGVPRAKALAMTGGKISAEQAESWGMIWQCVDDELVLDEAVKLAEHFATQPTRALGRIKLLFNKSYRNSLNQQLDLERQSIGELGGSVDFREGVAAFNEKRDAKFSGK